jgi:hypothetical protein
MTQPSTEPVEKIVLTLKTKQKRFARMTSPLEFSIGSHTWKLHQLKPESQEKGQGGTFTLVPA